MRTGERRLKRQPIAVPLQLWSIISPAFRVRAEDECMTTYSEQQGGIHDEHGR